MRIECPSCQSAYEVEDSLVAPGRVARCAKCGFEWMPRGPLPAAAPVAPMAPAADDWLRPEAPIAPPPPPPKPKPWPSNGALGWLATIVVLAALLGAGYAWRHEIMQAWPPIRPVYAALGLAD